MLARALELWPDHPLLLSHLANVLVLRGDFGHARVAVSDAMELVPDDPDVLRARALVAALSEDKAAGRYADELLEREPEDSVGHTIRGALAADRLEFVSASRSLDEAVRLDPSDREIADLASEVRAKAHPVLAPVRALWRFGRWRSYFLYLTIIFALAGAGRESIRVAVVIVWLTLIVVPSWFGPRFIRWRQKRRYDRRRAAVAHRALRAGPVRHAPVDAGVAGNGAQLRRVREPGRAL